MSTQTLEAVFFDLGRVIVDFDYMPAVKNLLASCRPGHVPDLQVLSKWLFDPLHGANRAFDTGRLTSEEFYSKLCRDLSYRGSYEEFRALWNGIFTTKPDVEEIIRGVAGRARLFLISNTNPLHFEYITRHYDILNHFEEFFLSYRIGVCKPERKIFLTALESTGVDASHSIFIDDIPIHVEAAETLGFQGSHFTSAEKLRRTLAPLLGEYKPFEP